MKKAIKKLKREIAYLNDAHDAIHALTAYQSQDIDELKRQTDTLFKSKSDLVLELGNIKHLVNSKNGGIDALSNKLGNLKSDVQTIAKHVQNLEAEKEKNCSCKEKSSIIDTDRPKEIVSPLIDFRNAVAFHYANAVGKSIVDYIKANPTQFKSGLAERKRETIQFNGEPLEVTEMQKLVLRDHFTLEDTNTQKTEKNATDGKQEGKKEYSETIVTNEMFNEELEGKLKKNILEYHPAFMLLNGVIPSNLIEDLIRAKLKSKGEHYSPNGDRYSNFKRLNNSAAKQKTVKERIENFMEKHEIWIEDYQAGDVNGTLLDLIESCIDVLNYYLLLDIYLKFNGELK